MCISVTIDSDLKHPTQQKLNPLFAYLTQIPYFKPTIYITLYSGGYLKSEYFITTNSTT